MLTLIRFWLVILAISIGIWFVLKRTSNPVPFYWVLLACMVIFFIVMSMLWGLSVLTGNGFPLLD